MNPELIPRMRALVLQRIAGRGDTPTSAPSAPASVAAAPAVPGSLPALVSETAPDHNSTTAQPSSNSNSEHDRSIEAHAAPPPAELNRDENKPAQLPKVVEASSGADALSVAKSTAAEGMPGVLSFAQDTYTVAPEDGIARLSLKRRGGSKGAISFKWWTVVGSAQPDKDFVAVEPRVEQMAGGQEQIVLFVPVVADATRKRTEYFEVQIDAPEGGARLGANTRATVILVGRD